MNILFLCTANLHRSLTAEHYYRTINLNHQFKSAGLSQKYCKKYGTTLCTPEFLDWADKIFVMEDVHVQRIVEHVGELYTHKIEVLNVQDVYQYMQFELLDKFKSNEKLQFLNF